MAQDEYSDWNSKRFMPTEITFIFMKFEGHILSSIGTRSIPVSRQAGWKAGRQAGTRNLNSV